MAEALGWGEGQGRDEHGGVRYPLNRPTPLRACHALSLMIFANKISYFRAILPPQTCKLYESKSHIAAPSTAPECAIHI